MCSDEKGKYDELIDDKGVKVLIDPKAMMHVIGTKMDFVDDKLRYRKHVTPLLLVHYMMQTDLYAAFIAYFVICCHLFPRLGGGKFCSRNTVICDEMVSYPQHYGCLK